MVLREAQVEGRKSPGKPGRPREAGMAKAGLLPVLRKWPCIDDSSSSLEERGDTIPHSSLC